MIKYTIAIEDEKLDIDFTKTVQNVMAEKEIEKYYIYGIILGLGTKLTTLKDHSQFIVIDELAKLGIAGYYNKSEGNITINAVVDYDEIFIKRGAKVLKYGA